MKRAIPRSAGLPTGCSKGLLALTSIFTSGINL
jgi:hypothetical protein